MSTNGVNSVAAQRANLLSAVQNAKTDGERFAAEKQLAMFDLQHKEDYTAIGKAQNDGNVPTVEDRQKTHQTNLEEIGKAKAQAQVLEQYHDLTYQLSQAVINGQDDVRAEVEKKLQELVAAHPELKVSNREELQRVSDQVVSDAAKLRETTFVKDEQAGVSATFYGNAEDAWQTANIRLDAPTVKKEVRTKDQIRTQIKEDAHFVADDGTVVQGRQNLKANRKSLKAGKKAAEKEYKAAVKAFNQNKNRTQQDVDNLIAAFEKYRDASMDYELGNRVYKTAKGNGTRKRARAIRKNEISDNRVVDRSHVYLNKKQADAAVKSGQVGKDNVGYINDDGLKILTMIKTIAQNHQNGAKTSFDEVFTDDDWGALSRIQIPTDKMTAEENEAATRANQTALRTLAGGGNRIEPTEKETLIKELKNAGLDTSRHQINKLYTAYGMEHENRFGNKVKDGLKAAAPVAVAEGLATAYRYKHSASARSVADATSTSTATATASKTVHYSAEDIQTVTAEAVVNDYIDLGELLGDEQYFGDGIEISAEDVKTATAHAKVEGSVTATAVATAIAVAKAHSEAFAKAVVKNPWLPGVVTTAAAFGVGFAASKGYENGVTKGAVKEFKRAEFLNLFKGPSAKGAAAEVIQTLDEIAKKTDDRAFADRIGANAYKHFQGVQNQVLTQRELEALNIGLKAILKELPSKPNAPTPPITETTPAPTEPPCEVELDSRTVRHPHTRRAGDTWGGLVKAYYPDCLPENGGQHKLSDCIRELKRQLAYTENESGEIVFDEAKFKALLKGNDLPKELLLPEKIFDCDYTQGEVKAAKIVRGGRRGRVLDNAGREYNHATKQDCHDNMPQDVADGTRVTRNGKTYVAHNGRWVEQ